MVNVGLLRGEFADDLAFVDNGDAVAQGADFVQLG
jgi:hypothetical protein